MKKNILIILSLVLLLVGCQQEQHSHTIVFNDDIEVEYDNSVNTAQFVQRVDSYPVSSSNIRKNKIYVSNLKVVCPKLTRKNVQTLGKVTLIYKIGKENYSFEVTVVDKKKPKIKLTQTNMTFEVGEMKGIKKYIKVTDNYDKSKDIKITVKGSKKLDKNKEGTYDLKIIATDTSGNKSFKKIKVTIKDSKREEEERKKAEEEQAKKEQEEKEEAEKQAQQQQQNNSSQSNQSSSSSSSSSSYSGSSSSSQSSSTPSTQDFLFSNGYDMSSAPSACQSALSSSGRSGSCTPIQDSEGIYLGMRLSLY